VLAFGTLTVGLVLTLFARLGHEVFVYVQRAFGLAFLLASYHVFTTDGTAAQSTTLTVYLAAMSTLGIAAFLYRSVLGNVLVRRRRYRVVDVNRLDEFVTEIVMEPVGVPLAYRPGQFVFVSFRSLDLSAELHPFELSLQRRVFAIRAGEIANQFHPFSITSAPGEPTLRITVKAVGGYTRALRRLEAGAAAVVEGPYGSFTPESVPNRRQIWAAGGIGVTPFLSLARSLGSVDGVSVDFYYCVEHEEEAHFLGELEAIARGRDDFRVTLVARDRDGFLTGRRLAEEHADLRDADVLVCGPPGMIESLREQLAAEGVAPERFHAEEFSFAKVGRESEAARRSDGRVLATLAAPTLAGAALGIAVIVGTYLG
jgi:predicted ferric reductase